MESGSDPLRKIPTKHVPDVKADVGTPLKAARAKKGASIDAVCQQTRIPKKYLEALENNRFDEFPAEAYLRGFLRNYCDYLELEFDPIWKLISEPAGGLAAAPEKIEPAAESPAPKPEPKAKPEPKPQPVAAVAKAVPVQHSPTPKQAKHNGAAKDAHHQEAPAGGISSSAVAAALIIAGSALALVGMLWLAPKKAEKTPAAEHQPAVPAALEPVKAAVEAQLTISYKRDSWVSVNTDGAERFQGRVPQGSKQEWTAKKSFSLRASDPQSLELILNGAAFPLPAPDASGTFKIEP